MKQENTEQISKAMAFLDELKKLRGGTVSAMNRRIANDPLLLNAFTHQYENCNKSVTVIPRKYKELILMALGCASKTENAVKTHGNLAVEHGATIEEIGETLRLVFLVCGVSGLSLGSQLFDELSDE